MGDYSILQLLGWLAVGLLMTIFALTGGFDLGAGMLSPFLGKTDDERRVVINTVGPTWDGNQVWLIAAGGAIFAIWPRVYAASFSGYYFAFLLVLWALFFRPVSFEYRSKLKSHKWRRFWDYALCIGSFIPALIVGIGIGNLFLGLPFQYDPMSLRFFYGPTMIDTSALTALFGLLRPFALLTGVISVLMMLMHGASYLLLRTQGVIHQRAQTVIQWLAVLFIICFAGAGFWIAYGISGFHWTPMINPSLHPLTSTVTRSVGGWLHNYQVHSWMVIAPLLGFFGAVLVWIFARANQGIATLMASGMAIVGVMATYGFSLFPFIMPSSIKPAQSLLVWNASSSALSLMGILITAVIMIPIIFIYTGFVYRKIWGRGAKMSTDRVSKESHSLY